MPTPLSHRTSTSPGFPYCGQVNLASVTRRLALVCAGVVAFTSLCAAASSGGQSEAATVFVESKVRPLLLDACGRCHSDGRESGGVRLDALAGVFSGGSKGPLMFPGEPAKSRLLIAARDTHNDGLMAPAKRLTAAQLRTLERWLTMGAPWPSPSEARGATDPAPSGGRRINDPLTGPAWWSFKPLTRPPLPDSRQAGAAAVHPIDRFIQARLEARGIQPNPPAEKRVLLRRLFYDLTGLPPSTDELAAFEHDARPQAYEEWVDRLLASPRYGERWGRYWLDVMRFAQSQGYERDGEKPESWRYRDYVVNSLNRDKPYDLFVREHIAGDEMADRFFETGQAPGSDWNWREAVVATGFARLGVWDDEPDDKKMAVFDELDDALSTVGAAFMGVTLGCARCHDHKFDPITQRDYYQLTAYFRGVRPYANANGLEAPGFQPLSEPGQVASWQQGKEERLRNLKADMAAASDEAARKRIQERIDAVKSEAPPFEWALAMRETGKEPEPTHVLIRGNANREGELVAPGLPQCFANGRPQPAPTRTLRSSGRRSLFADWLASGDNPLTARALVNRAWHHHFGRGLARSTTDLGRAGSPPTHPELIDWLASEFVQQGWSLKRLHKLILTSETWKRSSTSPAESVGASKDPGNELLWRQNLRRLDAEALRDTLLVISGDLNLKPGGRGFFPRLSGEVLAGASRPGTDWEMSSDAELARRSVFAYVRRSSPAPILETLDYNNYFSPQGERPVTTVAPQALLLVNDDFMRLRADQFAVRVKQEAPSRSQWVATAFQRALGRVPTRREIDIAETLLRRQRSAYQHIATRVTVRTEVPGTLSTGFFERLRPEHFATASRSGWASGAGSWPDSYEGNRILDRGNGPYVMWMGQSFQNGIVRGEIFLHTAIESAGLLLRWGERNGKPTGYELRLTPRDSSAALRRVDGRGEEIARAQVPLPIGRTLPMQLRMEAGTFEIRLGEGLPLTLSGTDPKPLNLEGRLGLRAWGAPFSLDRMTIETGGRTFEQPAWTDSELEDRALSALCLMILNLNETAYVD